MQEIGKMEFDPERDFIICDFCYNSEVSNCAERGGLLGMTRMRDDDGTEYVACDECLAAKSWETAAA